MEKKANVEPKSILGDVEESKRFWVYNGPVVKNLHELYGAIRVMSDDTFTHHVNESKNDFYNWVRDIYHDEKLANRLMKLKTRLEIVEVIKRRIEGVSKKPKIELGFKEKKARDVAKKTFKKKIIREPEKIKHEEMEELPRIQGLIEERGHIARGAIIALVIIVAIVGLANLPETMITGAATTELGGEGLTVASVITFVLIVVLAVFTAKKIKTRQ